jgi:hypothetical protein
MSVRGQRIMGPYCTRDQVDRRVGGRTAADAKVEVPQ